ncbi:hydroxyisourate hydrolase [Ornithobacterium rhinotracheale]|uniref:hydroxyisourate hydrolase n=1 Tax=Ornithobacterium rhinotracheale TaxID=28251 RepID=UPI004037336D
MKKVIILFALMFASLSFAQQAKYQLSSHILDIIQGKPAPGVKIQLSKRASDGTWKVVDEKTTDQNGRIKDFLKEGANVDNRGIYKLTYFTLPYFQSLGQDTFYPFVEVVFEIKDKNHYHVPITLSPYGYSTYRGN